MRAVVLLDIQQILGGGRFNIIIKVFKVKKSQKFLDGIKSKYVLIDIGTGKPRILIDNHEPYGFHMHTHLNNAWDRREILSVTTHQEALLYFLDKVRKIANEE